MRPYEIYSRSSMIAMTDARHSSPVSYRSISGTPIWVIAPSPMRSSIESCTTAIDWSLRASLCAAIKLSVANQPTPPKQKPFDPQRVLNDSPLPRHNRPGIIRNPGPASAGTMALHDRNTQVRYRFAGLRPHLRGDPTNYFKKEAVPV